MSMQKPDSMAGGDPYTLGSPGMVLFQRGVFGLLFLALAAAFVWFLLNIGGPQITTEVALLRFTDAASHLNLGVPFYQTDLNMIHKELSLPGSVLQARDAATTVERIESAFRHEQPSVKILFVKGYGDTNSDGAVTAASRSNDTSAEDLRDSASESVSARAVIRCSGAAERAIDATLLIDEFLKPSPGDSSPRLLVLDCSHAITNPRIRLYGNSFPALIRSHLQKHSDRFHPQSWVLLMAGVDQLSFPASDLSGSAAAIAFARGLKGDADREPGIGDDSGTIELRELYEFIWKNCAFEEQTPVLLTREGVVISPKPVESDRDRGPVLALAQPLIEQETDKSELPGSASGDESASADETAGKAKSDAGINPNQADNKTPPSATAMNGDSNGTRTSAEGNGDEAAGSNVSRSSAAELSAAAKSWDRTRSIVEEELTSWHAQSVPYVQRLRDVRRAAEIDFRVRFRAGQSGDSDAAVLPVRNDTFEENAARVREFQTLIRHADKRNRVDVLRVYLLAWERLMQMRFQIPLNVEWYEHSRSLRLGTTDAFRLAIDELLLSLARLETELNRVENVEQLNVLALQRGIDDTERAAAEVNRVIKNSLGELSATGLCSLFRTSLLSGTQRDEVLQLLQKKLELRRVPESRGVAESALEITPGIRTEMLAELRKFRRQAFDIASDDADDISVNGDFADSRPLNSEAVTADEGVSGFTEVLKQLSQSSRMSERMKWLRLASALNYDNDRMLTLTSTDDFLVPAPVYPVFPAVASLRLIQIDGLDSTRSLRQGQSMRIPFRVTIDGLDDEADRSGREIVVAVREETRSDVELQIVSRGQEIPWVEDPRFPDERRVLITTDALGRVEFEMSAMTAKLAPFPDGGNSAPTQEISISAAARIDGRMITSPETISLALRLPVDEQILLVVDSDAGIPVRAASDNRTLRILPNTVTANVLKLRNQSLTDRPVRAEIYAVRHLPEAGILPGRLFDHRGQLFDRIRVAYDPERRVLPGETPIARSANFVIPRNEVVGIPFAAAEPVATNGAPETAVNDTSGADTVADRAFPDVSHGLLLRVYETEEQVVNNQAQWKDTGRWWNHWIEVRPLRPDALYRAAAEWNADARRIHVKVFRESTPADSRPGAASGPPIVKYRLTDRHGWTLAESQPSELNSDGFYFDPRSGDSINRSILVDIAGYPRALRVDISCEDGRNSVGQEIVDWTRFRFLQFGADSESGFLNGPQGFIWQRKEPKVPDSVLFRMPFFRTERGRENRIPIRMELDFPSDNSRTSASDTGIPGAVSLSGSEQLKGIQFPRDRHHRMTLQAAGGDGSVIIQSQVSDWVYAWTPFMENGVVSLRIGPSESLADSDQVSSDDRPSIEAVDVLIDNSPPEIRAQVSKTSLMPGTRLLVTLTMDGLASEPPSSPVELIEMYVTETSNGDDDFLDELVNKSFTRRWPASGRELELEVDPEKLKLTPGRYVVCVRATDALGRKSQSRSREFEVLPKPEVKKEPLPEQPAPAMGVIAVRLHYNNGPLSGFFDLTAECNGERINVPPDGKLVFRRQLPEGTEATVTITGRQRAKSEKSITFSAKAIPDSENPLEKDLKPEWDRK